LITDESGSNYFCILQTSAILMNEPVVVLHESLDGKWYYIFSEYCGGWIKSESVAICDTYSQWKQKIETEDFLLVTGNKIVLEDDTENRAVSGAIMYMGTKLELVKPEEYTVKESGRVPYESYIVKIPIRLENGVLGYEYAFVPVSRDVNVGFLDFTQRNLITQMFKVNGDRYGWGGMYSARDCSQYIMDIYSCFGFQIARNSKAQSDMPLKSVDVKEKKDEEKKKILEKTPAGSILYFPGHVMLYLGESRGRHYVISPTARIIPNDSQAEEVVNAHTCMVTTLDTKRPNTNTWMEEITRIVRFETD